MPTLTIEIDEEMYSKVAEEARREDMTVSDRAKFLIERGIVSGQSALDAIRECIGSIDDPTFETPERSGPESLASAASLD